MLLLYWNFIPCNLPGFPIYPNIAFYYWINQPDILAILIFHALQSTWFLHTRSSIYLAFAYPFNLPGLINLPDVLVIMDFYAVQSTWFLHILSIYLMFVYIIYLMFLLYWNFILFDLLDYWIHRTPLLFLAMPSDPIATQQTAGPTGSANVPHVDMIGGIPIQSYASHPDSRKQQEVVTLVKDSSQQASLKVPELANLSPTPGTKTNNDAVLEQQDTLSKVVCSLSPVAVGGVSAPWNYSSAVRVRGGLVHRHASSNQKSTYPVDTTT